MYNRMFLEGDVKTWIAVCALCVFSGLAVADELEDAYNNLKAAEGKKDAEGVRKWASTTSKLARAAASSAQPAGTDADAWKAHLDYAKQVDTYSEYALATTASAPGMEASKVVELVDELNAINPKSKYFGTVATPYIGALATQAQAAAAKSPDRTLALANKLIAFKSKSTPEGVPEPEWEKAKSAALGRGYYFAGVANGIKQAWNDCNNEMKEALPYINKDQSMLGVAYFYLGLCNYQFGRLTADRASIMQGQKYSEQSAAIPGPMQAQARQNAYAIRTELAGGASKR